MSDILAIPETILRMSDRMISVYVAITTKQVFSSHVLNHNYHAIISAPDISSALRISLRESEQAIKDLETMGAITPIDKYVSEVHTFYELTETYKASLLCDSE